MSYLTKWLVLGAAFKPVSSSTSHLYSLIVCCGSSRDDIYQRPCDRLIKLLHTSNQSESSILYMWAWLNQSENRILRLFHLIKLLRSYNLFSDVGQSGCWLISCINNIPSKTQIFLQDDGDSTFLSWQDSVYHRRNRVHRKNNHRETITVATH